MFRGTKTGRWCPLALEAHQGSISVRRVTTNPVSRVLLLECTMYVRATYIEKVRVTPHRKPCQRLPPPGMVRKSHMTHNEKCGFGHWGVEEVSLKHHTPLLKIPVWWRRAVLPSLRPMGCPGCFLSFLQGNLYLNPPPGEHLHHLGTTQTETKDSDSSC